MWPSQFVAQRHIDRVAASSRCQRVRDPHDSLHNLTLNISRLPLILSKYVMFLPRCTLTLTISPPLSTLRQYVTSRFAAQPYADHITASPYSQEVCDPCDLLHYLTLTMSPPPLTLRKYVTLAVRCTTSR